MRHNRKVKLKLKKAMKLGWLSPPWPYSKNGHSYPEIARPVSHRTYMVPKKQQQLIIDSFVARYGKFTPWKGWKRHYHSSNRRFHVMCRACNGYGTEPAHRYNEEGILVLDSIQCTACTGKPMSPKAYRL